MLRDGYYLCVTEKEKKIITVSYIGDDRLGGFSFFCESTFSTFCSEDFRAFCSFRQSIRTALRRELPGGPPSVSFPKVAC